MVTCASVRNAEAVVVRQGTGSFASRQSPLAINSSGNSELGAFLRAAGAVVEPFAPAVTLKTVQDLATRLGQRFLDSGADLPDLVVMAMASRRRAQILTWDFRHFRSVVLRRGHHWPLVVDESELPKP